MRENFPFRVFIKDEYLKEGIASRNETDEIIKLSGVDRITMDNSIQIPDCPGQAMIIESADLSKREEALRLVLENIEKIDRQFKKSHKSTTECMDYNAKITCCS